MDWGPLSVRSLAPLFANRLSYTPGRVLPLARGVAELDVGLTHVNIWAQMPGYFFDGEWTRLQLRGGFGLGYGLEVRGELPMYGHSGGFMDGFIMGFHRLFRVTQARRDRYAQNQLRVASIDGRGTRTWLSNADAGVGLGNPTLGVKKRLYDGPAPWPGLVAEATVKLPFGSIDRQFATAHWAGMLDVALHQPLGAGLALYSAFGLIFSPGDEPVFGMHLAVLQKFLMVALEWRAATHFTVVLHYLNQDGIAESCTYAPLNQTTHEFVLGAKWAPGETDAWVMEAGIIENSVHDANTPDFGLHLAGRWRF